VAAVATAGGACQGTHEAMATSAGAGLLSPPLRRARLASGTIRELAVRPRADRGGSVNSFQFLHAADIHLDSPLRGLEADPDAPADRMRAASRDAFDNLVNYAIEQKVAFVLLAGDLYDGDWVDWRTGQFLVERAARLTRAGVRLYVVGGNHDASSVITRQLRLPNGAYHFSSRTAESEPHPELAVVVHGRSFPDRAVTEDLSAHYPAAKPGNFNIGLLHTSLDGRPGHNLYSPTSANSLRRLGYDYWALGHVHAREVVSRDPWVVFPGNLQGRHIREIGPKGASLVTVRDGRVDSVEHRSFDVVRWARTDVALDVRADNMDACMAAIGRALSMELDDAEGRLLAARVVLTGMSPLHAELVARPAQTRERVIAEARQLGSDRIWIEKVQVQTTPLEVTQDADQTGILSKLLEEIDALVATRDRLKLSDYAERLKKKLERVELAEDHPLLAPTLTSDEEVAAARELLVARLQGGR